MITINMFKLKVDTANVTFWLRTLLQQNSDLVEVVAKLEAGTRWYDGIMVEVFIIFIIIITVSHRVEVVAKLEASIK